MRATVGLLMGLWAVSALGEPAVAPVLRPDEKPRLLVTDLSAQGASEQEAAALTDALVQTLSERGLFQVISRKDLQTVLSTERQRQMLGACEEDPSRCASDDVRYVQAGQLGLGSSSPSPLAANEPVPVVLTPNHILVRTDGASGSWQVLNTEELSPSDVAGSATRGLLRHDWPRASWSAWSASAMSWR